MKSWHKTELKLKQFKWLHRPHVFEGSSPSPSKFFCHSLPTETALESVFALLCISRGDGRLWLDRNNSDYVMGVWRATSLEMLYDWNGLRKGDLGWWVGRNWGGGRHVSSADVKFFLSLPWRMPTSSQAYLVLLACASFAEEGLSATCWFKLLTSAVCCPPVPLQQQQDHLLAGHRAFMIYLPPSRN